MNLNPTLIREINAARGDQPLTSWVEEAIIDKLNARNPGLATVATHATTVAMPCIHEYVLHQTIWNGPPPPRRYICRHCPEIITR